MIVIMMIILTSPEAVSPVVTPDEATVVTGVPTTRAGPADPPAGLTSAVATAGADPPPALLRSQVLTLTTHDRGLPLQREAGAGRADFFTAGPVVNCLESLQHLLAVSEDSVGEEESVEEINGEKAEISQSVEKSLWCGVPDEWNFTIIEAPAKLDIHVILEQRGVTFDNGGQCVVVDKVDVVHALVDISDPGQFILFGWSHHVDHGLLSRLPALRAQLEVQPEVSLESVSAGETG